ncbi:ABC transporter permease [Streptomyces sp. NBC_00091]|uniref:ABC transporter permease n=1 Tax=Streptomyces sp. NBC_00091 TaxID=2975648 RepID=UPI00224EBDA1|nr:ABC transporter permease [Streptomyces sp. NBC_00091]MCX5380146.1 ABC transporter permease [Streptomyces sp. NBC_00091]
MSTPSPATPSPATPHEAARHPAAPRQDTAAARPRRLRGLAWLLVHQHRTALIACAAVTLIGAAFIVHQRAAMLDTLHATGWHATSARPIDGEVYNRAANDLNSFGSWLGYLPLLLGVFLGAPLIAADKEHGTARLVTTQSVPRSRWLLWKLCFALVLAAVPTLILSLLYSWWWHSVGPLAPEDWLNGSVFEATGPVLVATALFTTSLGIMTGALARRAVPAMTATFVIAGTALFGAGLLRERLATPRMLAYPLGGAQPAALEHAVQVDQWIGTASGKLYGWGTCVHETSPESCRASLGIVNSVWEYFDHGQMAGMQWTAAGVFLGLSALLVGAFLRWTRQSAL